MLFEAALVKPDAISNLVVNGGRDPAAVPPGGAAVEKEAGVAAASKDCATLLCASWWTTLRIRYYNASIVPHWLGYAIPGLREGGMTRNESIHGDFAVGHHKDPCT